MFKLGHLLIRTMAELAMSLCDKLNRWPLIFHIRFARVIMKTISECSSLVHFENQFVMLYSNFSHYDNRFTMVSQGSHEINNHFWSYNIGPVHIISLSTEFYYFPQFGTKQIETQYKWLEQDLIEANKPENRALRPWIITMGHRPLYAQNHIDDMVSFTFV